MAHEIRFYVHPNFAKLEEDLVKRVALAVVGTDREVHRQTDGYKWGLESGNDWKMDIDANTGEYIIFYRYGAGHLELMHALRTVLIWVTGSTDLNPVPPNLAETVK